VKKRVLFVDDEPNVLSGLRRMLRDKAGEWEMAFAANADEADRLLAERPFDAAVLDVMMPGRSGLELLAEMKASPATRDVEVVILTGLQDRALKRRALDLGAADLLNKPVEKEDIIARLNSVLAMKSFREELQAKNAALEEELVRSQKMELVGPPVSRTMPITSLR